MTEHADIIEFVDSIFDTVDAKDWAAAERLFDPTVNVDFTSLSDGDTATVAVKGYAYNVLDADLGGGMWEVWGAYDIPLRRDGAGWKATGITFNAWHRRGDDAVRTHLLSS